MAIARYDFGGQVFEVTYGFSRLQRNLCKRAGLYQGQPRVLTLLSSNEGCSLKELSTLCGIGMPSLSVSVRNMEKTGLIRREGAPRGQRLYLTELGRARAVAYHREIDKFYVGLLSELGEADTQKFSALLGRMEDYITRFNDQFATTEDDYGAD